MTKTADQNATRYVCFWEGKCTLYGANHPKAEKEAKWAGLCNHCRPIVAKHVRDFREGLVKQGLCRCNRGASPPGRRLGQCDQGGERFREFYGRTLRNRSKKGTFAIHAQLFSI